MRSFILSALLVSMVAWSGHAQAPVVAPAPTIVFDSFGPRGSYDLSTLWGVIGASAGAEYRGHAEWFVPEISGNLSTILLATRNLSGSGRTDFYLAQDNASGIPGTILENFPNILNPDGPLTLQSATQPLLEAGVKYWLCDEPADDTSSTAWYFNSINYRPGFAYERAPWSWEFVAAEYAPPSGVFRVSVTPIPEPVTTVLALFWATFLALRLVALRFLHGTVSARSWCRRPRATCHRYLEWLGAGGPF